MKIGEQVALIKTEYTYVTLFDFSDQEVKLLRLLANQMVMGREPEKKKG